MEDPQLVFRKRRGSSSGSIFFPFRIQGQKDSRSATKNLSKLTQKIVSKLSEI
jgi:hypothetical protein